MTTELVISVEGKVAQSNLAEFEIGAQAFLDSINRDLQTEADFTQAAKDKNKAKLIEDRIANAKQSALAQMEEVFKTFTVADKWSDKIRAVRLEITKLIDSEKAKRKKEMIDEAAQQIQEWLNDSAISHIERVNRGELENQIKGKSSLDKMRESLIDYVKDELHRLYNVADMFDKNTAAVEKAQQEYPGLFPDKNTLCSKSVDEVTAIIQSRIDSFKLAEIEKKRVADEKAAEEKRRAEVAAKLKAEPIPEPEPKPEPIKNEPLTTAPSSQAIYANYAITVNVNCTQSKAIELAKNVKALVVAEIPAATVNLKSV